MGRRPEAVRGRTAPGGPAGLRRGLALLGIAIIVVATALTTPAAAQAASPADTTLRITLQETGDATLRLTVSFPMETATDEEALARTEANASALAAAFHDGLVAVADRTAAETGRKMSVASPTTTVRTEGDRGVVELAVTWHGLAAVEDERLRLGAPFDGGFRPPGRFVLEAPDGYRFDAISPSPTESSPDALVWSAGTSLDGFTVTAIPTDGTADGSRPMPGFGAVVAVTALLGVALLAARTRR